MDRGAVTGTDVWPALLAFLEGTPERKLVASAFIGSEGATLLHSLGRRDLLICNASPAALRQGSTYPSALRALHTRGVTVRSVPSLHAKVYIVGDRAFVGSANASGTSTRLHEAGIFVEDPSVVAVLRRDLEKLSTSTDADKINTAFLDVADLMFRPPRAVVGHPDKRTNPTSKPMWFWSFGDDAAPVTVEAAAAEQRDTYGFPDNDGAATYDWSWGSAGAWKPGQRCVWVQREGTDQDSWWAQPPSECMASKEVGGRSKQWIYWWRTPNVDDAPWGKLRAHLLASTGQSISTDSSTRRPAVWDEVERFFGLGLALQ